MHDPGSIGPTFATWRHAQHQQVAVFFSCGAHNRAKGGKIGRPPRAPQAGVAVPDGPACTSPPPCIMPPRLLPHERRNPHCPPSPSPAHRADRVDRRDHTEGGPHERGRRRRPPRALAAASPGSRARSSAGWWPTSSLPRIGSRLKLRPISLRNDSDAEGQRGSEWADRAQSSRQRSGMHHNV